MAGAFVLKTATGVRILVHPVRMANDTFMPATYAYAMTIRRAQGSTLDIAALKFDRHCAADRGYGYVGSSRVRRADDLYLVKPIPLSAGETKAP